MGVETLIRARLRRYSKAIFRACVGGFKGLRELAVTRELCGSLFFVPSGTADGVILGKQNGGFVGGCWRRF